MRLITLVFVIVLGVVVLDLISGEGRMIATAILAGVALWGVRVVLWFGSEGRGRR
jgi:hypothetical protein